MFRQTAYSDRCSDAKTAHRLGEVVVDEGEDRVICRGSLGIHSINILGSTHTLDRARYYAPLLPSSRMVVWTQRAPVSARPEAFYLRLSCVRMVLLSCCLLRFFSSLNILDVCTSLSLLLLDCIRCINTTSTSNCFENSHSGVNLHSTPTTSEPEPSAGVRHPLSNSSTVHTA